MKKLIATIAAFGLMAGTAIAADWNFYGSARVNTFYTNVDVDGGDDTTNLDMALQGNARIGANVKVSDELTGRFEYGSGSANSVGLRLLYGEWNFGAGKLLIGQDYTPTYLPVSNQVFATDNGQGGIGEFYGGREAQIKLTFGNFQIAIVEPANTSMYDTNAAALNAAAVAAAAPFAPAAALLSDPAEVGEVTFPRIEANYKMKMDTWNFALAAGYQTFDADATANEESVSAYVVVARAGLDLGAFTAGVQAHMGQNIGNLGGSIGYQVDEAGYEPVAVWTGTELLDTDAYAVELILGYTVNDMFGLEAGVGYAELEIDTWDDELEVTSVYLQAPITMAPGVYVIPEVGYISEEIANDEVETTYFGAKWQINF